MVHSRSFSPNFTGEHLLSSGNFRWASSVILARHALLATINPSVGLLGGIAARLTSGSSKTIHQWEMDCAGSGAAGAYWFGSVVGSRLGSEDAGWRLAADFNSLRHWHRRGCRRLDSNPLKLSQQRHRKRSGQFAPTLPAYDDRMGALKRGAAV